MISFKIAFVFLSLLLRCYVDAVWIGEEYWTSIDKFGNILDGRTTDDFVTIDSNKKLKNPGDRIYVAFWILKDSLGNHEAFGTARLYASNKVCGTFLNRQNTREEMCGGFRVLSRHKISGVNPFEFVPVTQVIRPYAVTYRRQQPARIYSYNKYENFIGTANLRNRIVWGIESDSTIIKVEEAATYNDYVQNIEILIKNPSLENVDAIMLEKLRKEREEAERLRRQMEEEERLKNQLEMDTEVHNLSNDDEPIFRHRKVFN